MDIKEIKKQDHEALNKELLELARERFNLKIQRATGQEIKTHRISQIRKNIAQIKTVLREREMVERT